MVGDGSPDPGLRDVGGCRPRLDLLLDPVDLIRFLKVLDHVMVLDEHSRVHLSENQALEIEIIARAIRLEVLGRSEVEIMIDIMERESHNSSHTFS